MTGSRIVRLHRERTPREAPPFAALQEVPSLAWRLRQCRATTQRHPIITSP